MPSFAVVTIAADPNASVFAELARALVTSIRKLGYSCSELINRFDNQSVNIVLGYHLLSPDSIPRNLNWIAYQLEQLSDSEGVVTRFPHALELLKRASAVWDYAPENIDFLARRGIAAELIAPGFVDSLSTMSPVQKDVDVLFYGSRNPRRTMVLQELLNRGYRVQALINLYGDQRDSWIARAALVINIHFYETALFESVRVSYLVNNGVPVLSESSEFYPWESVPLERVRYELLVDRAEQLLQERGALNEYGLQCQNAFANSYKMSDLLAPLLYQL